jgi:hypothetical protein
MSINLRDISDAVQSYLNNKVAITIADLSPAEGEGTEVNPGESFVVTIEAANASSSSGGVALKNLKYRVSVDDGSVAKLVVPTSAFVHTTDLDGNAVTQGSERTSMIVQKILFTKLPVGDTGTLVLEGKASNGAKGGKTSVRARVLADVDLDELFPQGEDTPVATKSLAVNG